MIECPSRDDLRRYLLGTLAVNQFDDIEQHLDTCQRCQSTLGEEHLASDELIQAMRRVPQGEATTLEDTGWRQAEDLVKAIGREWSQAGQQPELPSRVKLARRLREYELLEELGRGGMGTVYKAVHTKLQKVVALKVLPADRMENNEAVNRFEREMQAVGRLDHPNIVRATDAGEVDGTHFLVMECVEGLNASQIVDRTGPLPIAEACETIRQAALGLQHAYENGMVHRDIKPSNLMLTYAGKVKILDLGLALLNDSPADGAELTSTNQIMGTLDYMAPEQAADTHAVDIRADLYSLGATLYKLLTGKPPFHDAGGRSPAKRLNALLNATPVFVREQRPDVPEELSALVGRLLEKDPAKRLATPSDLIAELAPHVANADLTRLMGSPRDQAGCATPNTMGTATSLPMSSHLVETDVDVDGGVSKVAPAAASTPRLTSRHKVALGLCGLFAVVLFGGVWLIIRDKDGNEKQRIKLNRGDQLEVADGERTAPATDIKGSAAGPPKPDSVKAPPPATRGQPPREIAKALQKNNVTLGVMLDGESDARTLQPRQPLPEGPFRITMADISGVAFLDDVLPILVRATTIEDLRASATGMTAEQLRVLAPLARVTRLDLSRARQITNELLQVAAEQFPELRELWLANTVLPESGVPALQRMQALESLNLYETANTDIALNVAVRLRNLTTVNVVKSAVSWLAVQEFHEQNVSCHIAFDTNTFVNHFGGSFVGLVGAQEREFVGRAAEERVWPMGALRMNLANTKVATDDLAFLPEFAKLQGLSLAGTPVTDGAIKHARSLRQLETLDVSNTALTDHGVLLLAALPALKSVDLRGTKATASAIAYLTQRKPECQFATDFSKDDISSAPPLFAFDPAVPAESPFDALKRADVDLHQLLIAGDGDPANAPPDLVGIFGDGRLRHWWMAFKGPYIAFTPDGATLVSAGSDGRLIYWDVDTGRATRIVRTGQPTASMVFLPQAGELVLSGHGQVPTISFGLQAARPTGNWGLSDDLRAVSSDGRLGISVDKSGVAVHGIWNVPQRKLLHRSKRYEAALQEVAIQPQGRLAATGDAGGIIRIWDVQSGTEVRSFEVGERPVDAIAFSPDGATIACSCSRRLLIQHVETGEIVHDVQGGPIRRAVSLAFSANGNLLAAGQYQADIVLVDARKGDVVRQFRGDGAWWNTVCFSPDDRLLAAAAKDGRIRIWDVESGVERHGDRKLLSTVTSTAISEDGRFWGTSQLDGSVIVRESSTGKVHRTWKLPAAASSVAINSRHQVVAVGMELPYEARLYSLRTGELLAESPILRDGPIQLNLTNSGRALVATNLQGQVFILDPFTLEIRRSFLDAAKPGRQIAVTRDGRLLVAADSSRRFHVIDVQSGQTLFDSPELNDSITSLDINHDGSIVAVALARAENRIRLWDVKAGSEVAALGSPGGTSGVSFPLLKFGPGGRKLYAAFGEGQIQVWDLDKLGTDEAMTLLRVAGPRDWFYALHVGPAGKHLLTHNLNGTIYVLRLDKHQSE